MNCPNCGAENSPNMRFCVECGASLKPQTPPSTPPELPDESVDDDQTILSSSNPLRPRVEEADISDRGRPEVAVPPPLSEDMPSHTSAMPPPLIEDQANSDQAELPQKPRKLFVALGACLSMIFFCICFTVIIIMVAALSDPDGFEDLLRELSFATGDWPMAMVVGSASLQFSL